MYRLLGSHPRTAGLLLALALLTVAWAPTGAALSASRGANAVALQGTTLETYSVSPELVAPATASLQAAHYVAVDRSASPRSELFVFLGGFLATPADASLIVQEAAAQGFRAVGLSYPKPGRLSDLCETNPDDGCFEAARRAIIYGGDRSAPVDVAPADTIVNQLTRLLAYLDTQHPGEGWANYLDNGQPRWSAIRLAGHSNGGSHAALIAQEQAVARLCLFESPIDLIGAAGGLRRLPQWIATGGATPSERIYGFRHVRSSSPYAASARGTWGLLGLDTFGPPVDVDANSPPYSGSHYLTTAAVPAVGDDTHNSVVEDRLTPRTASGEPLFAPVWQYACMS
jgi:hypothetical protein